MSFGADWSDGKKWLMGVASAVIIGLFGAGADYFVKQPRKSSEGSFPATVNCSTLPGYPLGAWHARGVLVQNGRKDTSMARELFFESPTTGTWPQGLGKQMPNGEYSLNPDAPFLASGALSPGKEVLFVFRRKEKFTAGEEAIASPLDRMYRSEAVMVVSADGCSMQGRDKQEESSGNITAIVLYCWREEFSCPSLRESDGWRPAVPLPAPGDRNSTIRGAREHRQ
jgi:hypothetical protein